MANDYLWVDEMGYLHGEISNKEIVQRVNCFDDLLTALKACKSYMLGELTELDLIETDKLAENAITNAEKE